MENYSTFFKSSKLHLDSEIAREEDRHLDSLKLIEEAIIDYNQTENNEGIARSLQSRCLTYKHLFLLTKSQTFAVLGKKDAEASLEITQIYQLNNVLGSAYFRLGEMDMLFEDYKNAIKNYELSLKNYTGTNCEKGDYKYHLGEAIYKSGDSNEGLKIIFEALQEIQNNRSNVNSFLANVWESGVYLRLSEIFKSKNKKEALKYALKAKKIADSDEKLIIRKRQINSIIEELNKK